ncbi:MAG: hypothetical protein RLZZ66_523 [Pseudomonadota bacterium]|jgi:hypothetical protein
MLRRLKLTYTTNILILRFANFHFQKNVTLNTLVNPMLIAIQLETVA